MKKKKLFPQTEPDQILSRSEVSLFRNSLKQKICVELLQDGYHKSFSELFSLLTSDQDRRAAAERDSAVRLQTPLEEQRDKMEAMRLHLRRAEQAENTASWTCVCEQRLLLGQVFSSLQDSWIALHFLHSCAERGGGANSGTAAEARVCMAEVYLQRGELQRARQQVDLCLQQSGSASLRPLRLRARGVLWRICSRLADGRLEADDLQGALQLLHEGHRAAAESEDKHLQSEAYYRLGLTYQSAGDHDTAQQFFNSSIQICSTLQDADGMGKCYKAMARNTDSEGNTRDTLRCLEKMAAIYRRSGQQHGLADALLCLGNIYFRTSQYMRACEYFLQSCKVSCELGDLSLLQKAQVSLAGARALSVIREHSADVEASSAASLRRLAARKETRNETWKETRKEARNEAWKETRKEARGPGPEARPGPAAHE